jgi:hypothetical protein
MDPFLQTLAGGIAVAMLGGIAFFAWELPTIYLRGFLFAAGGLAAVGAVLWLLHAGYSAGWADALTDVAANSPGIKLPVRTGYVQDWTLAGIFGVAAYVLFLGWVAVLSRRKQRSPKAEADHEQ